MPAYKLPTIEKVELDAEVFAHLSEGDTLGLQVKITRLEITRDELNDKATRQWESGRDWRMTVIRANHIDALIDRAYAALYQYRVRMGGN